MGVYPPDLPCPPTGVPSNPHLVRTGELHWRFSGSTGKSELGSGFTEIVLLDIIVADGRKAPFADRLAV
jgi:hypothetical protein